MIINKKRLLLTGGGTGGHLYPALALARHLRERVEVVYVGHPDKIEGRVVPAEGIPFLPLVAVPFARNPHDLPMFLVRFFRSLLRALWILIKFRPALVVGFGGYVSLPVGLIARMLCIPVAIHEQNKHAGLANRLLIRAGALGMVTFPGTNLSRPGKKMVVTGCPVRTEIGTLDQTTSRKSLGLPLDKKICLIMGGSGGARFLNETVLKVLPLALNKKDWFFLHVTGPAHLEEIRNTVKNWANHDTVTTHYRMEGYISEIAPYYAATDLAVCRSGSATVNELLCSGLPALLIPSPNVTDNHQEGNARYMESLGAAEVLNESAVTPETLYDRIAALLDDPGRMASMSANGRAHALGHAALKSIEDVLRDHCPTLWKASIP